MASLEGQYVGGPLYSMPLAEVGMEVGPTPANGWSYKGADFQPDTVSLVLVVSFRTDEVRKIEYYLSGPKINKGGLSDKIRLTRQVDDIPDPVKVALLGKRRVLLLDAIAEKQRKVEETDRLIEAYS